MSAVVGFFNQKAQKLLEYHLASGFRKYLLLFKGKPQGNHVALIQEGKDLVTYALINAIAIRKILKKYDKVYKHTIQEYVMAWFVLLLLCMMCLMKFLEQIHYSKQGQAFKSHAQSMHIGILQSPWLCELMAFHINLRQSKIKSRKRPALFEGCSLTMNDDKPSLTCELFDSVKVDIDLTCSICLVSIISKVSFVLRMSCIS